MVSDEDIRRVENKLDRIVMMLHFGRDEKYQLIKAAIDNNERTLSWSDVRKFPELRSAYSSREQFNRDMLKLANAVGLTEHRVGNKLVWAYPDVDVIGNKKSAADLGSYRPSDNELQEYLVKELTRNGPMDVMGFLDSRAPSQSKDWKDKAMDALERRPKVERAKSGDTWVGKDGKTPVGVMTKTKREGVRYKVGPDWFRMKAA